MEQGKRRTLIPVQNNCRIIPLIDTLDTAFLVIWCALKVVWKSGLRCLTDTEEETGFAPLEGAEDGDPEGMDDFTFEFLDSPPIETYFLTLDSVKG